MENFNAPVDQRFEASEEPRIATKVSINAEKKKEESYAQDDN